MVRVKGATAALPKPKLWLMELAVPAPNVMLPLPKVSVSARLATLMVAAWDPLLWVNRTGPEKVLAVPLRLRVIAP